MDRRSDVYSLGVVLYELLTGERPFRGGFRMVLEQVQNDEPRPPRRLNDQVPRDLETICVKAMAKPPAGRYATAAELAADLDRFLHGEPIRARSMGRAERLRHWSRRNPLVAGLAASVAVLLTALVAALAVEVVRARREVETERKFLSEALAGRGIALLDAKNSKGLFDLFEACRTVAIDAPTLLPSRARIWSGWHAALAGHLKRLVGHDDAPSDHGLRWAAFAPGGRWIVTTSIDGTARFWDARTGLAHGTAFRHEPAERHVAFTADGRLFVTQPNETTLTLWSTESAQPHGPPFSAPDHISRHSLSANGAWLAAYSAKSVRVWNTEDAKLVAERRHPNPDDNVLAMAFSPDSKLLATSSQNGAVELFDAATLTLRPPIAGHSGAVHTLAFSADGRLLATGSHKTNSHSDHTARIWNVATGEALTPPLEHDEDLHGVVFSPDGTSLATACFDNQARIWRVDGGTLLHRLWHDGPVLAVAFSPNGHWLASSSVDGTARIWDTKLAQLRGWPMRHQGGISSVAFSADSKRLVTASDDGTARVWSVVHGDDLKLEHHDRVWQVAFNPAGTLLAAGSQDGRLRIWDTHSGAPRGDGPLTHPGQRGDGLELLGVAFSSDGKWLATVGGPYVQLWDTATGQPRGEPFKHWARAVAFIPDTELLVSGGGSENAGGGTIHFWNTATQQEDGQALESQEDQIQCLAVSADGKWLASAGLKKGLRIWDVANRREHRSQFIFERAAHVAALAFSPDGATLAIATRDQAIHFWDLAKNKEREPPWRRTVPVNAIAYSTDGTLLALASDDRAAQVFDIETKLRCGSPLPHNAKCMSVAFSRDGRWLASGSFDTTVRLRRLAPPVASLDEIERLTALSLGASVDDQGVAHVLSGSKWRELGAAGIQSNGD